MAIDRTVYEEAQQIAERILRVLRECEQPTEIVARELRQLVAAKNALAALAKARRMRVGTPVDSVSTQRQPRCELSDNGQN